MKKLQGLAPHSSSKALLAILVCLTVVTPMISAERYALLIVGLFSMLSFFGVAGQRQTITTRELFCILSSFLILIPYILSGSLPYIQDGISLILCFCVVWSIASNKVEDVKFLAVLMIILTGWCALEAAYQRTVGHSFLSGHLLMFGWKVTGPYPFSFLDTYALVFIPIIWYAINRCGISGAVGITAIVLWLVMMVLTGNRSTFLIAASTALFSVVVASKSKHSRYLMRRRKLGRKITKNRTLIICALVIGAAVFSSEVMKLVPEQLVSRVYDLYDWTVQGDFSGSNRLPLWSAFFEFSKNYPENILFGYGFGTLLFQNQILFQDSRLNIDDLQAVWLDLIYSTGIMGTLSLVITLRKFFLRYRVESDSNAERTQIFLCSWFLSPFNLSHKLMDVWFCLNITLGLAAVIMIYYSEKRRNFS